MAFSGNNLIKSARSLPASSISPPSSTLHTSSQMRNPISDETYERNNEERVRLRIPLLSDDYHPHKEYKSIAEKDRGSDLLKWPRAYSGYTKRKNFCSFMRNT
jgi:hypothetical protein